MFEKKCQYIHKIKTGIIFSIKRTFALSVLAILNMRPRQPKFASTCWLVEVVITRQSASYPLSVSQLKIQHFCLYLSAFAGMEYNGKNFQNVLTSSAQMKKISSEDLLVRKDKDTNIIITSEVFGEEIRRINLITEKVGVNMKKTDILGIVAYNRCIRTSDHAANVAINKLLQSNVN